MNVLTEFIEQEVFNPSIISEIIAPDSARNSINWKNMNDTDLIRMMYL